MQNSDSGLVVVFMRHGDYDPTSGEITRTGQCNLQNMAKKLKNEYNIHPQIILTGPKTRAVQSAKVVAEIFGADLVKPEPIEVEKLNDQYGMGQFTLEHLKKMSEGNRILCVTHDTTVMGNLKEIVPTPEKKMDVLLHPPKVQLSDAVIVRIDGRQWAEVGEKPATYDLVLH